MERHRFTVVVVEKDDVEIAAVVELPATELPHRQHERPGRLAASHRPAEPLHEPCLFMGHHRPQDGLGDRCQSRRGGFGVEATEHLTDPDTELFGNLEGIDDRTDVDRAVAQFGELLVERLGGRQPLDDEAVEELVDHAGIADEDPGQERARGAELDGENERRGIEAKQFPKHPLAAE